MVNAAVKLQGGREFRSDLRAIDPALVREMTKVHTQIAELVRPIAEAKAISLGGMRRHFAGSIKSSGTQARSAITVARKANAAFWGSSKHSGWYADPQYQGSTKPQFPEWVGNTWEAGVPGQGPYAINDAVAASVPAILALYDKAVLEATGHAFPIP
jgi:hypothetical protein